MGIKTTKLTKSFRVFIEEQIMFFVATAASEGRVTQSNWEDFGEMAEMMRGGYGSSWGLLFEDVYAAKCVAIK